MQFITPWGKFIGTEEDYQELLKQKGQVKEPEPKPEKSPVTEKPTPAKGTAKKPTGKTAKK